MIPIANQYDLGRLFSQWWKCEESFFHKDIWEGLKKCGNFHTIWILWSTLNFTINLWPNFEQPKIRPGTIKFKLFRPFWLMIGWLSCVLKLWQSLAMQHFCLWPDENLLPWSGAMHLQKKAIILAENCQSHQYFVHYLVSKVPF